MFHNLFTPIDRFCERTTPFLMGQEVLNDYTHFAFFLGCAAACYSLYQRGQWHGLPKFLSVWLGVIGLASTSLHLYPIGLTYLADTTAIAVFMAVFTYHATRTVKHFAHAQALTFSLAFLLCTALASLPSRIFGQEFLTISFLPSLMFMVWLAITGAPAKQHTWFGFAASVFSISMAAHAADLPTCHLTHGIGTHWLWHICNGLTLFLLIRGSTPQPQKL